MIRKIARPMIASVYVVDGVDSILNADEHKENAQSLIKRTQAILPRQYARKVPKNPETVVRAVGGAKVASGAALAVGFLPRVSATVLAATAIPTMIGRHAFWETQDKEERSARRSGFLTNVALLGGLMITSMDTQGKPGLRWRANKAAETANKKVQAALPTKSETEKFADNARDWFGDASDKVSEYATRAQDYVADNKDEWIGQATAAGAAATAAAYKVSDYVAENKDDWLSTAQDNAKAARKGVVKAAGKAQDRADKALTVAEKRTGKAAKKAQKNADKLQTRADKAISKAQKKIGNLR